MSPATNAVPGPSVAAVSPGAAHDWFVYRCYDAAGDLAYVGRSIQPEQRWAWHRYNSLWPYLIQRREVSGPFSYDEAKAEELRQIRTERPPLNVTGNPDYIALSRADRDSLRSQRLCEMHVRHVEVKTGRDAARALADDYGLTLDGAA